MVFCFFVGWFFGGFLSLLVCLWVAVVFLGCGGFGVFFLCFFRSKHCWTNVFLKGRMTYDVCLGWYK